MRFHCCLILLALPFTGACTAEGPTDIVVHNVSDLDYVGVTISSTAYGDVEAGGFAGPHTHDVAYSYNRVELTIDGEEYFLHPIDYVGETPLGPGCFVYAVDVPSVEDRTLSIDVEEGSTCPE